MHLHPVLEVPICFVCWRQVLAAQEEQQDVFFCCDKCPAKFCETCVAKAYGGGELGVQQAHRLQQQPDESEEWACPKCQTPPPLVELQQFVQQVLSGDGTINMSKGDSKQQQKQPRCTREQVVDEYLKVEQERDLVDKQRESKRREIHKELVSKNNSSTTTTEEELQGTTTLGTAITRS